jgi:hypothetical protein
LKSYYSGALCQETNKKPAECAAATGFPFSLSFGVHARKAATGRPSRVSEFDDQFAASILSAPFTELNVDRSLQSQFKENVGSA